MPAGVEEEEKGLERMRQALTGEEEEEKGLKRRKKKRKGGGAMKNR